MVPTFVKPQVKINSAKEILQNNVTRYKNAKEKLQLNLYDVGLEVRKLEKIYSQATKK